MTEQPLTGSGVMEDIKTLPVNTDAGDHDKFSHYIHKDDMMKAFVEGAAVMAICGKVWVPTRDGKQFPVCPECQEIFEQLS